MLNLSSDLKIYAYTRPTDMRKGFNGLSGIVRSEFQSDPTDGSLFVFINRRRDRMKLLHFDGGGYWLYYRLLEAGEVVTVSGTPESLILRFWKGPQNGSEEEGNITETSASGLLEGVQGGGRSNAPRWSHGSVCC